MPTAIVPPQSSVLSALKSYVPRQIQTDFHSKYTLQKELGSGSFGTVHLAIKDDSDEQVAVKCIKRSSLQEVAITDLRNEIYTMMRLKHPHVIQLREVFDDDPTYLYMVMEYASGGEVFDHIIKRSYYTEVEARQVISQVASCLAFMHDKGIVHRDLKPENLVYTSDGTSIKIIDFGFARVLDQHDKLRDMCGTPGYSAPEVLERQAYRFSCDVWSLGVIMYTLLAGFMPFFHEDPIEEERKILEGELKFPNEIFRDVSRDAIDLIKRMLCLDPEKRLTARQVVNHRWCLSNSKPVIQLTRARSGLSTLKARLRWRRALNTTRAVSRAKIFLAQRKSFEGKIKFTSRTSSTATTDNESDLEDQMEFKASWYQGCV